MITAIIVDDESSARRELTMLLAESCPDLSIAAEVSSIPEAVKEIQKLSPDIVFLDIEMPGYSGFQLFDFFDKPSFEVIFITAHSGYALAAFEMSAIGYLLKPVKREALVAVVQKTMILRQQLQLSQRLETLKENMEQPFMKKIALPVATGYIFISPDDIIYLQADGAYTKIFLLNEKDMLISKKLIYFEKLLAGNSNFFRCHRSFLINVNFIKAYNKSDGGYIVMQNNHDVNLAKERMDEFSRLAGKI